MRIPIFLLIIIVFAVTILTYASYRADYEIGKRSIIVNPKGTITDLINDFKKIR